MPGKSATVVELDKKDVEDAIIDAAKKHLEKEKAKIDAGGSKVTIAIGTDGSIMRAQVRFGADIDPIPKQK